MRHSMRWFSVGLCTAVAIGSGAMFVFAKQMTGEQWGERIGASEFHCNNVFCETETIAIPFRAQILGLSIHPGDVLEVRIRDHKGWTEWMRVEGESDAPDFEEDGRPYALYLSQSISAIRLRTPSREQHDVLVIALSAPPDSAVAGDVAMAVLSEGQSVSESIVSRSSWLAGNGVLSEKEQQTLWAPHYAQPKKIVIHHTATVLRDMNGDAVIDHVDYQDAIRAIYSFHARARRWGDIGYNYIISPDGTVWEGRSGGDGIVAGHTLRSASCTKFTKAGIGFNDGSIGIALLGTYTSDGVSFAAVNALSDFIAEKSWEFGIEPSGSEFFKDAVYPNVLGHRDLDCTSCPGESVSWVLPDIVRMAQEKYEALVEARPRQYKAEIVDAALQRILFGVGEKEREVLVRFKNTGTISWRNYGDESVRIARYDITKALSGLDMVRMATSEDQRGEEADDTEEKKTPSAYMVATLLSPNVSPGQIGAFRLRLAPTDQFISTEKFVLAVGDRGWISGTELVVEAINGNRPYAALLENKESRQLTDEGETVISLEFKNMGTETWKQSEVALSFSDAEMFRTTKWKKGGGQLLFKEKSVAPGEIAHFSFPVRTDKPGHGELKPALIFKKETIEGSDAYAVPVNIRPSRLAEIDVARIPTAVLAAWRPVFSVTIKNTAERTIKDIALVATDSEKKSVWYHSSWKGKTTIDRVNEIKPGESATILFRVTPPKKGGTAELKLSLRSGEKTVYIGNAESYSSAISRAVRIDTARK